MKRWACLGLMSAAAFSGACERQPASTAEAVTTVSGSTHPDTGAAGPDHPLKVTCTTGMIADAVRRVGGSRVEVTALMGPGVDPHLYKATAGDTARLTGADMVFYNGLVLEGKMTDVLVALAARKPVIAVTRDTPPDLLLEPPAFAGHYDPHVWFDVSLWTRAVKTIGEALAGYDPAHAAHYQSSTSAYLDELTRLHEWCLERCGELSAAERVLITSHDAYNYFGRAYGFEVIGVQGISTEEQATARAIVDLSKLISDRRIKAIFTESSVSPKAIHAVMENCRSAGWQVAEGGQLFSDAMDEPGKPAGNYVGMVKHNVNTIVEALR